MAERPEKMDAKYIEEHFGELLVEGFQEVLAHVRGEPHAPVRTVVRTARDTEVVPPPVYAAERIAAIREQLGMSQAVFARALNVSAATVTAWERGVREPAGAALRLLEFAEKRPEQFGEYLRTPVAG